MTGRFRFSVMPAALALSLLMAGVSGAEPVSPYATGTETVSTFNDSTVPMTTTLGLGTGWSDFGFGFTACDAPTDWCGVDYTRAGTTVSSVYSAGGVLLNANTWYFTPIVEPGGSVRSDGIWTFWSNDYAGDGNGPNGGGTPQNMGPRVYTDLFSNDWAGWAGSCADIVDDISDGCSDPTYAFVLLNEVEELNTLQHHTTVNWANGVSDVFLFDSAEALAAVPEPASLLLFGTGLLGCARSWRRRHARA